MATMRAVTKGSPHPDPVAELRFKVELQPDLSIGRFTECTGLSVEVETKEYMEGLLKWFFESRFTPKRRDMTISLLGPGTKLVRTWVFMNAYPVKWTGPNLNANSNTVASESLEIVHNGLRVV